METTYFNTPEGTRDRLFSECRDRRSAQSKITGLFKSRGYSEIVTPEIEYYDLFLRSGDPLPQESMMKMIDRSSRILVLRPDCTTPIARVAATKLAGGAFPQRLYYNETIFRSSAAHKGAESEIAQCGIELIGAPGLRGDLEVLAMAVDTLEACGLADFHIELGHLGFFRALAEELAAEEEAEMRGLIEQKNYAALGDLLAPYGDDPTAAAIRRIPLLFGGTEILAEARGLTKNSKALAALNDLERLHTLLKQAGRGHRIRFDLGLITGLDYYTDVVFQGFVRGAGRGVLSGGRYDELLSAFGQSRPATGFAVYVDDLAACLPPTETPELKTLVHFDPQCLSQALDIVDSGPNGEIQLSPCETETESLELAREKGAHTLTVLTADGRREVAL